MSLTPTTKLEAINELLDAIGETPVNTITDTGLVEADLAISRLDRISRSVQKRGWHWNTFYDYTLEVDTDGFITLPASTLEVDSSGQSQHLDVINRGGRLYNKETNTFVFTDPVVATIVLYLDFEDLPENARCYITQKAARKFQQRVFGSSELAAFDREDEQQAWFDLLDAESDTQDFNMLTGSASVLRVINRKYFNKD